MTTNLPDPGSRLIRVAQQTTAIGVATRRHDPLFLPRVPVNDCDDAAFLRAKLAGAYDWLHAPQLASKRLRSLARPAWQPHRGAAPAAAAPDNP